MVVIYTFLGFLDGCDLHLFEYFFCKSTAFCLLAQVEMVCFLKETWIIFPKALERNKANDLLELYIPTINIGKSEQTMQGRWDKWH